MAGPDPKKPTGRQGPARPDSGRAKTLPPLKPAGDASADQPHASSLLRGDSGTAPPPAGIADLAPIFSLGLSAIRSPLEDAVARFDEIARATPAGSPLRDGVSRAKRGVFEAKRVLDSLHLLARSPRDLAPVKASSIVPPVVKAVKDTFTTDTIEVMDVIPQGLPDGIAEPLAIRFALLNLIVAGIRAISGAGMVHVIARAGADGGFDIEVDDQGPPVAARDRESVFEASQDEKGRRSGLALHLARRLAHRACVRLDTVERNKGAAFVLRIPPKP